MRRIRYASVEYLADDRMTEAVLQYAKALAEQQRVEVVELPVGSADGSVGSAQLLIGAGIPIAADSLPSHAPPFDGQLSQPAEVLRLRRLADGLTRASAYQMPAAPPQLSFLDDDFL